MSARTALASERRMRIVEAPEILCQHAGCTEPAEWVHAWQTHLMPAPAFYHFCDAHMRGDRRMQYESWRRMA